MEVWLGGSYDDANYNLLQDPNHPFHMVYGLMRNDAIKNAISLKSVSLLSETLLASLVVFNQKVSSFEQHINRLTLFNTSDPVTATKAFYYYDKRFSNQTRTNMWKEFEKIAKKLNQGKNVLAEEIYLIGNIRMLKDLHVIGIGSENNRSSLRYSFLVVQSLIRQELNLLNSESQFKPSLVLKILNATVMILFIILLVVAGSFMLESYKFMINASNQSVIVLATIILVSIILGIIKYGSLQKSFTSSSWQLKFVEIWNDCVNFLISGLIGYYFATIRFPKVMAGSASLDNTDLILLLIFAIGAFGHLCVISKNLTDGIQEILQSILKKVK
jgi:hypothetical protein